MKKTRMLAALCAAVTLCVTLPAVRAYSEDAGISAYIGEAAARDIALKHAKVAEADAVFLKTHLDYENRRVVYDVEFVSGNAEYDYEIGATDGRVWEYDRDIEYYRAPNEAAVTTRAGDYIGEDAAKSVALEHAGLAEADVSFVAAYLDYDDRRVVYDVAFYSGDAEYDYEIDAESGEILESDMEIEYFAIPKEPAAASGGAKSGGYITEDEAAAIALAHAGITETAAENLRARLDYDGGRVDIDIDFTVGATEYEYEVDAFSGEILEFDRETRRGANRPANAVEPTVESSAAGARITEAEARAIALAEAGLTETQVRRVRVKLDRERRRDVYEIEFKSGRTEYEFEIDAATGEILEWDSEYDD